MKLDKKKSVGTRITRNIHAVWNYASPSMRYEQKPITGLILGYSAQPIRDSVA